MDADLTPALVRSVQPVKFKVATHFALYAPCDEVHAFQRVCLEDRVWCSPGAAGVECSVLVPAAQPPLLQKASK
jgi:hypothetical protein